MDEPNDIKGFFEFVGKRQKMWHRRFVEKEPYPWTDDMILRLYKFTNVYRELDKGTQYLWERIDPKGSFANEIYQVVLYRFINNISVFETLGGIPTIDDPWDEFFPKLEWLHSKGVRIFSGAYRTICNCPAGDRRIDELRRVMEPFVEEDNMDMECLILSIASATEYEEFNKMIQQIKHVGAFLAYEIATDMINVDEDCGDMWTENDWVNVGPGAVVGMQYVAPERNFTHKTKNNDLSLFLNFLRDAQVDYLPKDFPKYEGKDLTLRNIEHSLCEYGKYCNIKKGVGRFRPLYSPFKQDEIA
jgi:hypothetical protein|tara:strand:- start:13417 stop:14322 length:906 start_codon:yes stop_codon:yes gene_type:complete